MKSEHVLSCDNKTKIYPFPVDNLCHRLRARMNEIRGWRSRILIGQREKGKQLSPPLSHHYKRAKTKKKMERMQGEGEVDNVERPSPLTDKDKVMILDSWVKVYQNCDDAGVAILIRLFVNFPSSKQYFSKFKNIEEPEELEKSPHLRNHARRVMNSINTLVENLDNPDKMASLLKQIGKAHSLRHKVEPVYFKILNRVILEVLGEEFPEVMTAEVAGAWTKLLSILYSNITTTYEEVGWMTLSTSTG
ncbi:cytoglobin-1-like isoform X2 [Syngnathoides biaculeatus]|uniref:cytoglobin-1-like isoform X2 n=1 Tax=Syngnathoides biaculeatus TaxID=300417 RepID=UPI002ADDE51D|nr:cytoglobin-1-like isoform X2 [Syngnathoides biaculeatus]